MAEILQGTTPSLEIKIKTSDFLVADVVKLELAIRHSGTLKLYSLADVTVDSTNNSFIYKFTEAETLAMIPKKPIIFQLRFMFADDSIIGTEPRVLHVADLMSQEAMSE